MQIFKPLSILLLLGIACQMAFAITESDDEISLRDANSSRERPKLDGYDMDEATQATVEAQKENFNFNADVSRLMDIVINSLYTNKEVFIRELISNASDALDKARFLSVADTDFLAGNPNLEIKIDYDFDAKTISITDSGVGMTKAELVKNLGTVAKSGTTSFLEAMGSGDNNMSMIGQFGVGFYSAFLVANKVTVTSKSNDDEQHVWTSTADSKFFVTKDPRGDTLGRGTRVTLHLKDDSSEFVEQDKIKNLVKRYSEFINYPISLYVSHEERVEVPEDYPEPESKLKMTTYDENGDEIEIEDIIQDDMEIVSEDESETTAEADGEVKMKTITQQKWDWEVLNEIKAVWLRPKDEITEREYKDFYRTISKDPEDPIAWTHFSAEGEIEFKAILYVPSAGAYNMMSDYYSKSSAMKLYVRRVLIQEEFEDLMPRYLNFIRGVVDSDDLPLNVSRDQLQQMKMIKVMSKKLVRKAIDMIRDLAEESYEYEDEDEQKDETLEDSSEFEFGEEEVDEGLVEEDKYEVFWKAFGKNIKLGVIEDSSNRQKLAKLLRFDTTEDEYEMASFDEYISRMKDDQDTILYLAGDNKKSILENPILKKYVSAGYEVLLLWDPIDEFCIQNLSEYEKRKVKSIANDDVNVLDNSEIARKKNQKLKEMYAPLITWFKTHLKRKVEKVEISSKLGDTPLYIFTQQYGYSAQMEKINRSQAFMNQEKTPSYMMSKKTLELNPHHPIMKELLKRVKQQDGELDEESVEYADLLFEMALLNSGFDLQNPTELTTPLERLIRVGFGVDRYAEVEEIEVEIEEDVQEDIDSEFEYESDDEMINDEL